MKTCTKCGQSKTQDSYFVRDNKTGRLHSQCKSCYKSHRQSYSVAHYVKYGDAYRMRAKMRRAEIRKVLQGEMLAYLKDKSCSICGESDIRTLEFDHLVPAEKSFSIAKGITDGKRWSEIQTEIRKCRLLCANCHKKHTASQNNWYRLIKE